MISTVTVFGCNWKLNQIWLVFPICVDVQPKNMKAGRGLRDHLFWTLHFVHGKQGSWGANLGVEPDSARKMGLCKDFKYWLSVTPHNDCYNPLFYFLALFWVHEKRWHSYGFCLFVFLTLCTKYSLSSTLCSCEEIIHWRFSTFWFNVDVTNCLYSKCLLDISKNILIFSSAWKFLWFFC